jgi:DNA processing protein
MGNIDLLKVPAISIVGAREASYTGLTIAKRIAMFLAKNNIPVVSGLALGIDAAAHQGAVDVNGPTIAVLASGVDVITPKSNLTLAKDILQGGGVIVSEQPPGTPARRNQFVPRNRIQVGLSIASVIVESTEKSGTMTHAKFCYDEKHPLFTVFNKNLEMNLSGASKLIREYNAFTMNDKKDYIKLFELCRQEHINVM